MKIHSFYSFLLDKLRSKKNNFATQSKNILRKFRYLPISAVKKLYPLSSRSSLVVLVISFLFFGLSFFGSNFAVKLIYDPELSPIIPRWVLTIAIVSPVILIYLNFLVLIRIVIDRLRKRSGTLLRFKIVSFFMISLIVPSLFFMILFLNLYDYTIKIFNNELLLNKMEENLQTIQTDFRKKTQAMEQTLLNIANTIENGATVDKIVKNTMVYDFSKLLLYQNSIAKTVILLPSAPLPKTASAIDSQHSERLKTAQAKANATLTPVPRASIPYFPFTLLLDEKTPIYSSYDQTAGYLYSVYRLQTIDSRHIAITQEVSKQQKQSVDELLSTIGGLRQFQLITGPLKLAFLFTVFYLYLQIFSISVLIFYQRSNKYLYPIQDLIQATKTIVVAHSDKELVSPQKIEQALGKLNFHLKKMGDDEIANLLLSFRKMAIELQQNRKRIQNISEIEGWKEVAKRLAHEIKNPLTPIQLAVSDIEAKITQLDFNTYEEMLPSFNLIYREVDRIRKLANEFSMLSKAQRLNKSLCNFRSLLDKVSNYFSYRKDIVLDISQNKIPFLEIDEEKIYGLMINLIQNAIHSIDSLTEKQANSSIITISSKIIRIKKERSAEISVIDHGIGIANELQEEIFKPHFTSKSSGTGLGLAIAQQIAYAHRGNIYVSQSDKQSTTITLLLPLPLQKIKDSPDTGVSKITQKTG